MKDNEGGDYLKKKSGLIKSNRGVTRRQQIIVHIEQDCVIPHSERLMKAEMWKFSWNII